jgi:Flp pilus assembly protein TadG
MKSLAENTVRLLLRLTKGRDGATAVEFALVAPALFLTLFASVEFARLMWTQSALHFAVESAARCASVTPATCGTASQTATYAAGLITPLNVASSAFTATTPSCGHKVSASFTYRFILTGLFPSGPTLSAQACFP